MRRLVGCTAVQKSSLAIPSRAFIKTLADDNYAPRADVGSYPQTGHGVQTAPARGGR